MYFWGLGDYGFIDADEGRYAEIPREMIETGDYITPRLNYALYFEKPPMHYWLTAGAFMMFGENEFAGRVVPVMAGLGCCVLAFVVALKVTLSKYAAGLAGLMLASSVLWFGTSRINITDMTLTFFFTAAMTAYYFWYRDGRLNDSHVLCDDGTCCADEGFNRRGTARRNRVNPPHNHQKFPQVTRPVLTARSCLVPRYRCAVFRGSLPQKPGLLRVLLHPRTLPALHHDNTREVSAVLVLHPNHHSRLHPLDGRNLGRIGRNFREM